MLQAIVRNKGRRFLLGGDQRRPVEDVMTDCVFGGLRYFDPQNAGTILAWLIGDVAMPDLRLTDVELWPRRQGVEPDAVLRGRLASGQLVQLLVECKWGANKLAREQVDRQRDAFVDPRGSGSVTLQVFVVQNRSAVDEDLISRVAADPTGHKLLTWRDVAASLAAGRARGGSTEARRWAADVIAVLNEVGERPFSGDWPRQAVLEQSADTLFYAQRGTRFAWPAIDVPPVPVRMFFNETTQVGR